MFECTGIFFHHVAIWFANFSSVFLFVRKRFLGPIFVPDVCFRSWCAARDIRRAYRVERTAPYFPVPRCRSRTVGTIFIFRVLTFFVVIVCFYCFGQQSDRPAKKLPAQYNDQQNQPNNQPLNHRINRPTNLANSPTCQNETNQTNKPSR